MPEQVGGLEVDEVGDRRERVVKALAREDDGERGLGVDDGVPGGDVAEPGEQDLGLGIEEVRQRRIELPAAPIAGEFPDSVGSPMR